MSAVDQVWQGLLSPREKASVDALLEAVGVQRCLLADDGDSSGIVAAVWADVEAVIRDHLVPLPSAV